MTIQYRILIRNGKCYPQTRVRKFIFFSRWKRINRHLGGSFGLYNNFNYSLPEHECFVVIREYHDWFLKDRFPLLNISIA